uniref:Uncharacterized protein n=1 Tax=Arundo donax TaxID=35708 RepID=A0A0A9BLI6_ARUDO
MDNTPGESFFLSGAVFWVELCW